MLGKREQVQMQKWLQGREWGRLRWEIAKRDGYRCQLGISRRCVVFPGDRFEVDHIISRLDMGSLDLFWEKENLRMVCVPCHRLLTARQNRLRKKSVEDQALESELNRWDELIGQ